MAGFQYASNGTCANQGTYKNIDHDYQLQPIKPTLDGEPLYEEHPNCFNAKKLGYSVAGDIRRIMYWNVFAGGFGQSYGCHDVWQMYKEDKEGINGPLTSLDTRIGPSHGSSGQTFEKSDAIASFPLSNPR